MFIFTYFRKQKDIYCQNRNQYADIIEAALKKQHIRVLDETYTERDQIDQHCQIAVGILYFKLFLQVIHYIQRQRQKDNIRYAV